MLLLASRVVTRPIDAVIFDYGGVLSVSPFGRIAALEAELGLAPGSFSQLLGYGLDLPEPAPGEPYTNVWHLFEIGAVDADRYAEWVAERSAAIVGFAMTAASVREQLAGAVGGLGIHWMVVQRARALRAEGYRLAICTNNIAPISAAWRAQLPLELFDAIVDSCELGIRKPDPRIYAHTLSLLDVPAERTVFLDDHPANVAAAAALGLRTVFVGDDPWAALAALDAHLAP